MDIHWTTLHIFGYGETQVCGTNLDIKKKTKNLPSADALIRELWKHRSVDHTGDDKFHCITISKDSQQNVQWVPKSSDHPAFNISLKDFTLCQAVVNELVAP